jgi:gliding motility-associated-like protein
LFSQPGYTEWYTFGDTLVGDQINLTWDAEGIFQFQAVRWELGCSSYPQNITVTIQLCPQELIYIPNSFTPDGDEHNQLFSPIITSGVDIYEFHMTIYNRWGETIWESFDTTGKWDGTYNGKICPDGLYNWTIEFGLPKNDGRKELNGYIMIIR